MLWKYIHIHNRLQIVIHLVLHRGGHRDVLLEVLALVLDPETDELLRENSAFREVSVVLFEGLERGAQGLRQALYLLLVLLRQLEKIEVIRSAALCHGVDLVLDAV